jgi:hypothetical protein
MTSRPIRTSWRISPFAPSNLHATIFRALGIPSDAPLVDPLGRSFPVTAGQELRLF